jgi:lysine/ornithine N-monooxygenase
MSLQSLHLLGSALDLRPYPRWHSKMMMPSGHNPHCTDFVFRCDPLLAYWVVTDILVAELCFGINIFKDELS